MEEIRIDNLSKSYQGIPVLQNVVLYFPKGKTSCVMAPSGKGKTTLLRILLGLEKADRGAVTGMEGVRCSAVFQEDRLCANLSVSANIRLVRRKKIWEKNREEKVEVQEAIKAVGLEGCENQPVRELSGGMRRRVALLRALYAEWDVLFLDEPFKGLDLETKEQTIAFTREKCRGKTVILVTHDEREAELMGADKIQRL